MCVREWASIPWQGCGFRRRSTRISRHANNEPAANSESGAVSKAQDSSLPGFVPKKIKYPKFHCDLNNRIPLYQTIEDVGRLLLARPQILIARVIRSTWRLNILHRVSIVENIELLFVFLNRSCGTCASLRFIKIRRNKITLEYRSFDRI